MSHLTSNVSLHYLKYLCHKIACSARCSNLAERWTLQNHDSWQTAAAILNKMYWFFHYLPVSISILFGIISRRFSCKLKKFNKKLQKCFSLKKIKHLLRFLYIIMGHVKTLLRWARFVKWVIFERVKSNGQWDRWVAQAGGHQLGINWFGHLVWASARSVCVWSLLALGWLTAWRRLPKISGSPWLKRCV